MKVFLLSNRPEQTTRLMLMKRTLEKLGHTVVVPVFTSHNWIIIAHEAKKQIKKERPDILHLFNVPDIIYTEILKLQQKSFQKFIYDYRSPWGIEIELNIGFVGRIIGEYFESKLARRADAITTVNQPLSDKVRKFLREDKREITIVPNYPLRDFSDCVKPGNKVNSYAPVIFIGRICRQEGAGLLSKIAKDNSDIPFWIVGEGPLSWWYRKWMGKNVQFLGWQPHHRIPEFIGRAGICLIPRLENALTPYSTDKSIWKLNEYLNLGKPVIASGITREEARKNLTIVPSSQLSEAVRNSIGLKPSPLAREDYRFWEDNTEMIRSVYESVMRS
jgi:glycosyltransferase involved in cell wall biosynthesis